jgi:uroporphyrinogen-III synthase
VTATLDGYRVGITSTRKVDELTDLLTRKGASVESAPALSVAERLDDTQLREATFRILEDGVDIFVACTAAGIRAWMDAADSWGVAHDLVKALSRADILARGPKVIGALRSNGLRELWSPSSECMDDVLAYLRTRDVRGKRIVLQEYGQSLTMAAEALRLQGAMVEVASIYRCDAAPDLSPVFALVAKIALREVDAVTFTSAPAVTTLMSVATASGHERDVIDAFNSDVIATCVGPVTASAFGRWGIPTISPNRSRLVAMVRTLESELRTRDHGTAVVAGGHRLLLRGDGVYVDGNRVHLAGAQLAILRALVAEPGVVVSRRELAGHLPSGTAASEHAVEMAVARLRTIVGPTVVSTVVKRGYRLAVDPA